MANGDKAAAKGWTTFPASQAHSAGYDDVNYALDRTADEVDRATAAEALKLNAAVIQIATTENPAWPDGTIWLRPIS